MNRRSFFKLTGLAGLGVMLGPPLRSRLPDSWREVWCRWRYPRWDVRHWGAVGDGVHDDYQAFQRAIKNEPRVSAREGAYYVSMPLVVPAGHILYFGQCSIWSDGIRFHEAPPPIEILG